MPTKAVSHDLAPLAVQSTRDRGRAKRDVGGRHADERAHLARVAAGLGARVRRGEDAVGGQRQARAVGGCNKAQNEIVFFFFFLSLGLYFFLFYAAYNPMWFLITNGKETRFLKRKICYNGTKVTAIIKGTRPDEHALQ